MDILWFDRKLVKIAGQHTVDSLFYISLMTYFAMELFLINGKLPGDSCIQNNGGVDFISHYHLFSVIGHIAKRVEQLMRSQLARYLEEHSFITPGQSVYLKDHSTQTSLHRVIDDRLECIIDDQIIGVCLVGISKCFDTINHSNLLQNRYVWHKTPMKLKCFFFLIPIIKGKLCSVIMHFRVLLNLSPRTNRRFPITLPILISLLNVVPS